MNKKIPFILLLFFIHSFITAVEVKLEQLNKERLNNEISLNQFLIELKSIEQEIEGENQAWEELYFKGQILLLKGQVYWEQKNKRVSIKTLEESIKLSEESLKLQDRADTRVLISEALSLLMLQKGMVFTIANFSKTQDEAKKALELEKDHPRASLIIAQFLCNAPSIAGGDKKRGEELLLSLSKRVDISRMDRFFVLQSLSEFYENEKRYIDSESYCYKALDIYPQNSKTLDLLADLKVGKR